MGPQWGLPSGHETWASLSFSPIVEAPALRLGRFVPFHCRLLSLVLLSYGHQAREVPSATLRREERMKQGHFRPPGVSTLITHQ
jgi:hypothetical protein